MDTSSENFVELNRNFFELPREYAQEAEGDNLDIGEALGLRVDKGSDWPTLLKRHRVIILAEAGAGKTAEIQHVAGKLRADGKNAFFLRLEHIPSDLSEAFEEGTFEEFQEWLASTKEGWLLLDSVDEARLKHPLDFERAIRKISQHIRPALQRVHIIITGRVDAWRAKTDLQLCNKQFPFEAPNQEQSDDGDAEISHDGSDIDQVAISEAKRG